MMNTENEKRINSDIKFGMSEMGLMPEYRDMLDAIYVKAYSTGIHPDFVEEQDQKFLNGEMIYDAMHNMLTASCRRAIREFVYFEKRTDEIIDFVKKLITEDVEKKVDNLYEAAWRVNIFNDALR